MSTPSKYVQIQVANAVGTAPTPKHSLTGYRVIGDYVEQGVRYVTLQRPESAPIVQKASRAKQTPAMPPVASNAQETASQEVSK